MKVAILSESPADEAAIRILVEAILKQPIEPFHPPIRTRGWPPVSQLLPAVIKHLYYQTDASGLVVVVDSDTSVVHVASHEQREAGEQGCRLCELRQLAKRGFGGLRKIPSRGPLNCAIGLAVPAIEAWLRCGVDGSVNEANWIAAQRSRTTCYTRGSLKLDVYGSVRAPMPVLLKRAEEEARRLSDRLDDLVAAFPNGFGALLRGIEAW